MKENIKRNFGKEGEDAAVIFLKESGYKIIERNYRFRKIGELDIIAEDPKQKDIVFIEVKTRASAYYGSPEYEVTTIKKERIKRLAEGYIFTHNHKSAGYRFDVIVIDMIDRNKPIITHHKNSF